MNMVVVLNSQYKRPVFSPVDYFNLRHVRKNLRGLLSGKKINSVEDAWKAIDVFHEKGCRTVIISSSTLEKPDELVALASSKDGGKVTRVKTSIPKMDGRFVGSGDLFAALVMAWLYKSNGNLQLAVDNTMYSLQAVLRRTLSNALALSGGATPTPEQMELQLIQSKADIESPTPEIQSTLVEQT